MSLEDDKREGEAVPDPTDAEPVMTLGSEEEEDIPGPADSSPEILEIPSAESPEKESSPKVPPTPPPSSNPSSVSLVKASKLEEEEDDDDDEDFEDETTLERIVALSEMFPPGIVKGTSNICSFSISAAKWLFSTSKIVSWAVFSSVGITLLPIIIESERSRIVEAEKQQQRQILLGPGAAVSGSM